MGGDTDRSAWAAHDGTDGPNPLARRPLPQSNQCFVVMAGELSGAFFDVPRRWGVSVADRPVYPRQRRRPPARSSARGFGRDTQYAEMAGELVPPLAEHRVALHRPLNPGKKV
jgi:hypothetical protein